MYRPKINFAGISLRLDTKQRQYYLCGKSEFNGRGPVSFDNEVLVVQDLQTEVEIGLIRFVKDESIRVLIIEFRNHSTLLLWKKEKRGEYGVHATGIPTSI